MYITWAGVIVTNVILMCNMYFVDIHIKGI